MHVAYSEKEKECVDEREKANVLFQPRVLHCLLLISSSILHPSVLVVVGDGNGFAPRHEFVGDDFAHDIFVEGEVELHVFHVAIISLDERQRLVQIRVQRGQLVNGTVEGGKCEGRGRGDRREGAEDDAGVGEKEEEDEE